jgi:hypothetical protein
MQKSHKKQDDKQNETQDTIQKLVESLSHPNPQVRVTAWHNLGQVFRVTPGSASTGLVSRLLSLQFHETDQHVWRTAANTISEAFLRMDRTAPVPSEPELDGLGEWLWSDFREPSRVLRVADPERLRRDEDAVIEIARSLPLAEFPRTEFVCVDPGGFAPLLADLEDIKALCFVGRLCLYGAEAAKSWGVTEIPKYRFGMDSRPPGLPSGELHPEYHSVRTHAGGSGAEQRYKTTQIRDTRTDYGLVRRYVVQWGGRCRVVIHIAGCSSLGTLGATHFAANTLFQRGMDGNRLPLPPRLGQKSQLEALVQVTANVRRSELGWRLNELKLLDLRTGEFDWDQDEYCWHRPTYDLITLVFPDDSAKRAYRDNERRVEILVDNRPARFRGSSENRRLCLALVVLASSRDGHIELDQLAEDTWIWKDGARKSIAHVKSRLSSLQRHLGRSLDVDETSCRLIPSVRIEVRQPSPASSRQSR